MSLASCGGDSSSTGVSGFAGTYGASFTRDSDSSLFLSVNSSGNISVLIDDIAGSSNPWTGTGTVSDDGAFTVTNNQSRSAITIDGQFFGSGSSATFNASLSGGSTAILSGGHVTAFTNYTGVYNFTASGGPNSSAGQTTGTLTLSSGGRIAISAKNGSNDQWTASGTLSDIGLVQSSGTYTYGQNSTSTNFNFNGTLRFGDQNSATGVIAAIPKTSGSTTTYTLTLTRSSS